MHIEEPLRAAIAPSHESAGPAEGHVDRRPASIASDMRGAAPILAEVLLTTLVLDLGRLENRIDGRRVGGIG